MVSRSSAQASSGAVDDLGAGAAVPAGNLHRRIVEGAGEAEAAAFAAVRRNGEIDERHRAELAVDDAGGLDVVGDGQGDEARGDLARRVDEAVARDARTVDLEHDIGSAACSLAPAQHVLARAVGVAAEDCVARRGPAKLGHDQFECRMRALDLDPLGSRRGATAATTVRQAEEDRAQDAENGEPGHIGEQAQHGAAEILRRGPRGQPHAAPPIDVVLARLLA